MPDDIDDQGEYEKPRGITGALDYGFATKRYAKGTKAERADRKRRQAPRPKPFIGEPEKFPVELLPEVAEG